MHRAVMEIEPLPPGMALTMALAWIPGQQLGAPVDLLARLKGFEPLAF